MPQPPKVMHLDEFDHVKGPGTLTWLPVRNTLGIRAFGTNAYIADAAGDDVVEPHDEAGEPGADPADAHQELYFVARGHATFTIDERRYDAPTGTYVFIPDPESQRHAVATEPGTTVISFGGPPTFKPSSWEWAWLAAPLIQTDPVRCREILTEGLKQSPDSPGIIYTLACLEAVQGDPDRALALLERAIELRPKIRQWAREDDELEGLRGNPSFTALIADADPG